jgi:cellulose biosynthesis protein BcsQ
LTTIHNSIAVVNGKGGVLKTTTVSHVAAIAAAGGWRVLAVDVDGQANLSRDLGYVPDGGVALRDALLGKAPLTPLPSEGREGLDYVAGGAALDEASYELQRRLSTGDLSALRCVEDCLAPVAGEYDLIVIDSPPGEVNVLRRMILAAAHYVVLPCHTDTTSIPDGLANLFRTIADVRSQVNADLEVLGVTLGPVRPNETRRLARARDRAVEVLGDADAVLQSTIRENGKIADDCRELGIVATEYEQRSIQAAAEAKPWYKRTKKEREAAKGELQLSTSAASAGLAADWQAQVDEILGRYSARQAERVA